MRKERAQSVGEKRGIHCSTNAVAMHTAPASAQKRLMVGRRPKGSTVHMQSIQAGNSTSADNVNATYGFVPNS